VLLTLTTTTTCSTFIFCGESV